MAKFGIIGVGGFVAARHLQAIRDVGGEIVCACDKHDSVGRLDSYSYNTEFFLSENDFFEFVNLNKVDIISICSPNYLHVDHIIKSLQAGADVICEKPLVLSNNEIEIVNNAIKSTGRKVGTILQLRVHPSLIRLKNEIDKNPNKFRKVELRYVTSRGKWYLKSWKGDHGKSGGLASNIGIHFFDLLCWFFGDPKKTLVTKSSPVSICGELEFDNAKVSWLLSVDTTDLPKLSDIKSTFRSIKIDGEEIEFSDGFTELHTVVYKNFLIGKLFGVDVVRPSIRIAEEIRNQSKDILN